MSDNRIASLGALYYPYIHIQDLNWLKANLLMFPFVSRMIPLDFTPRDDEGIRPFTKWHNDREPLLRRADLWSERSIEAQSILAKKLQRDSEDLEFREKYGIDAAREHLDPNHYGFQIHAMKLSDELREALTKERKLAWPPVNPETYDIPSDYVEVHPRLGEAVMSTLAIACAKGEGLDIVGDERSGQLRQCLLKQDLDDVYDTWLKSELKMDDPRSPSAKELFEFILGIPGDLSDLTTDKVIALNKEREPIDKLFGTLRKHAAKIPAMDEGTARERAFQQETTKVLENWAKDRQSLRGFSRDFFGESLVDITTKFMTQIAGKALVGMGVGASDFAKTAVDASTSGSATWFGSLETGPLVGVGAGLLFGILVHSGKSYVKGRKREAHSLIAS